MRVCITKVIRCTCVLMYTCNPAPGEQRMRYFQLLVDGAYTPRTLPVGAEDPPEASPCSLADILQVRPAQAMPTCILLPPPQPPTGKANIQY